ncbi:hypothetical protein [Vibrio parahaemolyticus]|uniref:hypothetical protein n=2 Tax=Vibrio parahaemolyticus TaxID=670 RepID=UPI0004E10746|nr:hypothetical protein [Vibrio parahaemolyticus]EHR5320644.1 hypothetical protein [Vibrio parahaemolyticus]ELA6923026.1 hypothetical protein [Vibrio parahaemolyticus]ELA9709612.1 hypothetical protein [Vibrio parahaemolyticus]ELA9724193.1 hypothetical protein [Vibrio parahaemolyticus]MCR9728094.1 hypothetical protein [Vibrio parahaemolyticus]
MSTKTGKYEINPDTIVLSPEAIQLFRKLLSREESETQRLFDVAAHWPKAERENLEDLADKASIKPLAELESFVRTQELMRMYKRKAEQESKPA